MYDNVLYANGVDYYDNYRTDQYVGEDNENVAKISASFVWFGEYILFFMVRISPPRQ